VGMSVSVCDLPEQEVALDEQGRFALPLPTTLAAGLCDQRPRLRGDALRAGAGSLPERPALRCDDDRGG
jgi:hypothetical protein